jgi:Protein of unknown function (DUF2771)
MYGNAQLIYMKRRTRAIAALAFLLLVTACAKSPEAVPEVTFAVDAQRVVAKPTQQCDVQVQNCTADPKAAVAMKVPPGKAVDITVPPDVAKTPWLVVFGYRTKAGERVNARSDLLAGDTPTYTLTLPDVTDQLETVEVQQVGGTIVPGQQGVEFPTRATWVLSVDDRA